MTKLLNFAVHNQIRQAMKDAAQQIALKHGIAFEVAETGQSHLDIGVSVKFMVMDQQGLPLTADRDQFARLASRYGLQPSDYHRTFRMNNSSYKIIGIEPSRPRFSIRCQNVRKGTECFVPADCVQRALGIAQAA